MMKKVLTTVFISVVSALLISYLMFEFVDKKHFLSKHKDQRLLEFLEDGNKINRKLLDRVNKVNKFLERDYFIEQSKMSKEFTELDGLIKEFSDITYSIEASISDSLINSVAGNLNTYFLQYQKRIELYFETRDYLEKNSVLLCQSNGNKEYEFYKNQRIKILSRLVQIENLIREESFNSVKEINILKNNFIYACNKYLETGLNTVVYKNAKKYQKSDVANNPLLFAIMLIDRERYDVSFIFIADEEIRKKEEEKLKKELLIKSLPNCL
jgi:hypothetical protein